MTDIDSGKRPIQLRILTDGPTSIRRRQLLFCPATIQDPYHLKLCRPVLIRWLEIPIVLMPDLERHRWLLTHPLQELCCKVRWD